MTDPSSLIAQLYHAKYYPNSTFLNSSLGKNPSYTWRNIWATRDLLWARIQARVLGMALRSSLRRTLGLLIQSRVLLALLLVQILIM